MKKLTETWLRRNGACNSGIRWFTKMWPKGTDLREEDVEKLLLEYLKKRDDFAISGHVRFLYAKICPVKYEVSFRRWYYSDIAGARLVFFIEAAAAIKEALPSLDARSRSLYFV